VWLCVCIYIYIYIYICSFFLLISLPFYPVDGMTVFSGLLVSSALWKSGSDEGGADLFLFL
jgi:hypothetical protein